MIGLMAGTAMTTHNSLASYKNCSFFKQKGLLFGKLILLQCYSKYFIKGGAFALTDHSHFLFENCLLRVFYFLIS